jgi:hypothetical protein
MYKQKGYDSGNGPTDPPKKKLSYREKRKSEEEGNTVKRTKVGGVINRTFTTKKRKAKLKAAFETKRANNTKKNNAEFTPNKDKSNTQNNVDSAMRRAALIKMKNEKPKN